MRSVQAELRPHSPELGRLDQAAVRHGDRMQYAFDRVAPELEETAQLRKAGRQIVVLPDKSLQQGRVIGKPIEDVGGGQAIAGHLPTERNRLHVWNLHSVVARRYDCNAIVNDAQTNFADYRSRSVS